MARRRRFRKPILPGLWTVVAAFVLAGSIGGLFWALGSATRMSRATPTPTPTSKPPPAVVKGK